MPLNVPATVVAIFCLSCDINDALLLPNITLPGPILSLPSLLPAPKPASDALPYPRPTPITSYSSYAAPTKKGFLNGEAFPSQTSIAAVKLPSLKQGPSSPAQGIISSLTSMVGGFVPYLSRPEAVTKPVQALPTTKVEEEKVSHLDHEHGIEPIESLPDGIVSGGFYYEGEKADGGYFNEEMPESESLEVHSHDEVSSPGKLYDDKSEHPYYVVDKPAEGPAPPPLVYFTSGLRTEDIPIEKPGHGRAPSVTYLTSGLRTEDILIEKPVEGRVSMPQVFFTSGFRSNDATVAAWSEYYAKLRRYYDQYYPSFRRSGRAKAETNQRA